MAVIDAPVSEILSLAHVESALALSIEAGWNQTPDDWRDVEIWLNSYFRITVPSIPSRRRFQAPLDAFVSGYGHRFNFSRMQITALRLSGKRPDGSPVEVQKQFQESGLAGALGVKR